jgi:hypothetical protein
VDEGFAEEISARPGFVSYELIDCGDGEFVTISVFGEADQAEASRDLARAWTDGHLADLQPARIEALRGAMAVSRAVEECLEPAMGKFASLRRYILRSGDVDEVMHIVDREFAEQIQRMNGFEAYHTLDCGRGEILSISLFRDQAACEDSDEQALGFVKQHLSAYDIERSEVMGGEVLVSRARSELLVPAHA